MRTHKFICQQIGEECVYVFVGKFTGRLYDRNKIKKTEGEREGGKKGGREDLIL